MFSTESPTRSEKVKIYLELDKNQDSKYKDNLKIILGSKKQEISRGDILKVDFDFFADYFGEVEAKLDAISRILTDSSVVRKADIQELKHGRSVVVDVVQHLTRIIDQLEKNNG